MLHARDHRPAQEQAALAAAARAYERALALSREAGDGGLHYAALNLAALQWRLGAGDGDAAALATRRIDEARAALQARAAAAPDFWSVCGLVEVGLLEALVQRRLAAALAGIRAGFADLAQRVPAPHLWQSVHDQARFVLQPLAQDKAALALLRQLAALADGSR